MDEREHNWWRIGWISLGIVLAGVVGFVVLSFLGTFVTALFLYYATRPFHERIDRYVGQPTVAAVLTLLALAVPILALVAYTAAITIQELNRFAERTDLGPIQDAVAPYTDVSSFVQDPASILANPDVVGRVIGSFSSALSYLGLVVTVLLHVFVVLALAFYLLRDGGRLAHPFHALTDRHEPLAAFLEAVDRSLQKIFFGNLLNAIVTGAIGAVSYSLLNAVAPPDLAIPYPALVGVLAGIASLIPVVGMKLVWVPLAAILAVRAGTSGGGWGFVALFTGVSLVIVDAIPDLLLRPYVSGRSLHVGAVMLAYILGPLLFGWYGIFLGPLLLVVLVHFYRLVLPELLAGGTIRPEPTSVDAVTPNGSGAQAEAVTDSGTGDRTAQDVETDDRPEAEDEDGGDQAPS